jgi:hypothetical protein
VTLRAQMLIGRVHKLPERASEESARLPGGGGNMGRGMRACAVALCFVLLLSAACGSKKKNNNNAASAVATRTPVALATATPTLSAQALLSAAQGTLQADKSFHFILNHENGTTPIAEGINMRRAEGDILKPDKFMATVDGTIGGKQSVSVKAINVGSQVWVNIFGDKYTLLPNGVGAAQFLDPNNGVAKAIAGAKNPQSVGQDTINGVATTEISATVDAGDLTAIASQAQAGKSVPGKIWIGNSDHQVYRIRIEGPLNDQEPANIARQIDLSKFNEPLDIQPPA